MRRAVPVGWHSRAGSKPTCYTRNRKNSFSSVRERVDAAYICWVIRFGAGTARFSHAFYHEKKVPCRRGRSETCFQTTFWDCVLGSLEYLTRESSFALDWLLLLCQVWLLAVALRCGVQACYAAIPLRIPQLEYLELPVYYGLLSLLSYLLANIFFHSKLRSGCPVWNLCEGY